MNGEIPDFDHQGPVFLKKIDLRSDTVTRPTAGMRWAMLSAEVGDDMLGEDPTVNRLEATMAAMFGKQAAVFACSGTQSNQLGVRVHCMPGDELLINETGHIANFEAGGPAALSGVTVRTISAPHGMLDVGDLEGKVRADDQHYARTRLVCLENTTNMGGGRVYPLDQLRRVAEWARRNQLKMHLDGARLFNAIVAAGYSAVDIGACFDTISICFSKGLGCPMGSVLVGDADDIAKARRFRKMLGGAMRQTGTMAAAAVYAIERHIDRLAEDHRHAKLLAKLLGQVPGIRVDIDAVETNLVFFEVDPIHGSAAQLTAALKERGVLIFAMGPCRMRAVTHHDVSADDITAAAEILRQCLNTGVSAPETIKQTTYSI